MKYNIWAFRTRYSSCWGDISYDVEAGCILKGQVNIGKTENAQDIPEIHAIVSEIIGTKYLVQNDIRVIKAGLNLFIMTDDVIPLLFLEPI